MGGEGTNDKEDGEGGEPQRGRAKGRVDGKEGGRVPRAVEADREKDAWAEEMTRRSQTKPRSRVAARQGRLHAPDRNQ